MVIPCWNYHTRDIMKKMVNKVRILALVVSALIISLVPVISSKANSTNWNVYYVAGGGNKYETNVFVYTSGGGYTAECTGVSGNCTARQATITSTNYTLNKTVAFTRTSTLSFNTTKTPSTTYIYFKVRLSCSGGSSASLAGTIKGK